MIKKSYELGFIEACVKRGLDKKASVSLYKVAGRLGAGAQIFRGIKGLWRPVKDIGVGTARAMGSGAKKVDTFADWINNWKGLRINHNLAKSFSRGTLSKIPGIRTFGKGFARAQRAYEKQHGLKPSLLATLGVGKGSLIGNSIAGMSTFTSAHPYLGALGYTLPAALIAAKMSQNNNEEGTVDTLTPSQKRMFDRTFRAGGYSGLGYDADDVSLFGAL